MSLSFRPPAPRFRGDRLCRGRALSRNPEDDWIPASAGVLSSGGRQNKAYAKNVNGERVSTETETPKIKFKYKILNYTLIISEDSFIVVKIFL